MLLIDTHINLRPARTQPTLQTVSSLEMPFQCRFKSNAETRLDSHDSSSDPKGDLLIADRVMLLRVRRNTSNLACWGSAAYCPL